MKQPTFILAAGFVLGIAVASWLPLLLLIPFGLISLVMRAPALAVGLGLGAARLVSVPLEPPVDDLSVLAGNRMEVRGTVVSFPEQRDGYQQFVVRGAAAETRGKALVRADPFLEIAPGDRVLVSGRIKLPEPVDDFDYRSFLAKDGIHSIVPYAHVGVTGHERTVKRVFWSLRRAWVGQLQRRFPEPTAGFLLGILIGERSHLSDKLVEAFRRTSTTHILALSGFNVSIIVAAIVAVLGRRPPALIAALGFILCFVLLVGPGASIVRAALMGGFLLVGQLLGRPQLATYAVVVTAAAMLAVNPHALRYDLGFDLSFLATLGILWLEPGISGRLPWLPTSIRGIVSATIAASIPAVPVIAASFGTVSLVSPVANLLVVPMIPWLMLGGFIGTMLSLVPGPFALLPVLVTVWSAELLLAAVIGLSDMPLAAVSVGHAKGPVALGLTVLTALLAFRLRRTARA
ncbi:MAG: ComEC/Rec2 family competence protein [Patescibacteria group bacterium]